MGEPLFGYNSDVNGSEPGTADTAPARTPPTKRGRPMSILRVERRARYTPIDARTLRDARLSFRALGLLCLLLSQKDGWPVNSEALARVRPEGKHAIRAAMAELIQHGYVTRKREQTDRGRWVTLTIVRESPSTGFQASENQPFEDLTDGRLPGAGGLGAKRSKTSEEFRSTNGEACASSEVQELVAHYVNQVRKYTGVDPPSAWKSAIGGQIKKALDEYPGSDIRKALNAIAREGKAPNALLGVLMDFYREKTKGAS